MVGIIGSATRPSGTADVGLPPDTSFYLLPIDEARRTERTQFDLVCASFKAWLTPPTKHAITAAPCQLSVSCPTLTCTQRLVANHGVHANVAHWLLQAIVEADMTPPDIVAQIDLMNMQHSGMRCRQGGASLVTTLAPL